MDNCRCCGLVGEIEGRGLRKSCYNRHHRAGTLRRYPLARRPGGRHIVGTERQTLAKDLVKRYTKGESVRALASSTGRSYGFVHRVLTESEVQMRKRGGSRKGHRAALRDIGGRR